MYASVLAVLFLPASCFSAALGCWNNTLRDFGWFLLTAQAVIRHRPSRETFISFPVSYVVNVLFYSPPYLPVACGYWNHLGPDLWLMTESGTSSLLSSAAPETFIISPVIHHPSHCPIATLVLFYFSFLLVVEFPFRPSFVTALVLSGANLVSRACSSRFEMDFLIKSSLPKQEYFTKKKRRNRLLRQTFLAP